MSRELNITTTFNKIASKTGSLTTVIPSNKRSTGYALLAVLSLSYLRVLRYAEISSKKLKVLILRCRNAKQKLFIAQESFNFIHCFPSAL